MQQKNQKNTIKIFHEQHRIWENRFLPKKALLLNRGLYYRMRKFFMQVKKIIRLWQLLAGMGKKGIGLLASDFWQKISGFWYQILGIGPVLSGVEGRASDMPTDSFPITLINRNGNVSAVSKKRILNPILVISCFNS
ncbi:MAG TPA: hypothetical protein ENK14_11930 [Caldithrix sp.]|nr:hypothetical protein [Caldithrix sp.]